MPADEKKQPIVVKKIKKGGGGHHGGAWKVAYADFVTAMMAFFLLMWLVGSSSEAQRAGISEYFKNPSAVQGPGGASTSVIDFGGAQELPQGEKDPLKDSGPEEAREAQMTPAERAEEKARLDKLLEQLKEQIESSPILRKYKEQLFIDITSEGLRIQIVDRENRPMFALGSADLKWYMEDILHEIATTIASVPNHVSITGHTDAHQYSQARRRSYSNWELSADRANAARRELIQGGLAAEKIGRVVGLADSVLFNEADPFNPVNRRIAIVVLNKATERAIGLTDGKGAPAAVGNGEGEGAAAAVADEPAQPPEETVNGGADEAAGGEREEADARPAPTPPGDITPEPPNPMKDAIEGVLGPPPEGQ